jgi:hypothetical protein
MALGRPRRWAREDVLLIAARRAQGQSWREIGRSIGTSGGHAHDLFYEDLPTPRELGAWDLLQGDVTLYKLFRTCGRPLPRVFRKSPADRLGSRARAAAPRPAPGRGPELARTSVIRKMGTESVHRRRLRRVRSRRSESRGPRA